MHSKYIVKKMIFLKKMFITDAQNIYIQFGTWMCTQFHRWMKRNDNQNSVDDINVIYNELKKNIKKKMIFTSLHLNFSATAFSVAT